MAFTQTYGGVCDLMASARADPDPALHASSSALHSAGARLLVRAQAEGTARSDIDGEDLFALMSALSWLAGQPSFAPRADHLFHIVASAILTGRSAAQPRGDGNERPMGWQFRPLGANMCHEHLAWHQRLTYR